MKELWEVSEVNWGLLHILLTASTELRAEYNQDTNTWENYQVNDTAEQNEVQQSAETHNADWTEEAAFLETYEAWQEAENRKTKQS